MFRSTTALTVLACLCITAIAVCANPNIKEVKAFRAMVTDFSPTSGGKSPALSPDQKTLAYQDEKQNVWILHDERLCDLSRPTCDARPWKLEIDSPGSIPYYSSDAYSSLQWSPDGSKLAIAHSDGILFVAESFDYTNKQADTRIIAKPKVYAGEATGRGIMEPRWSPDGKKIAFLRVGLGVTKIAVYDFDAKTETLVAQEVSDVRDWLQPWSPDSSRLVFVGMKLIPSTDDVTTHLRQTGVYVVGSDGKGLRRIMDDQFRASPIWSPNSEMIAMIDSRQYRIKVDKMPYGRGLVDSVVVIGADGKGKKIITSSAVPTAEEYKEYTKRVNQKCLELFEHKFASQLTKEQLNRLRRDKLTEFEMESIPLCVGAKAVGGEFEKFILQNLKALSSKERLDKDKALQKKVANQFQKLPKEKAEKFGSIWAWFGDALLDADKLRPEPPAVSTPVWSPDGKRIAFKRGSLWDETKPASVMVVDLDGKNQRNVFESQDIANVEWAKDGKLLVVQSRRAIGRSGSNESTRQALSYPEIWLLEIK